MSDFKANAAQSADQGSVATPAWRERRNQIALAGLGGVAVVALGAYFLLVAGGSDEDLGPVQPPRNNAGAPISTPVASTPAPVSTKIPEKFDDTVSDPFAVLYAAASTPDSPASPDAPVAAPPSGGGGNAPTSTGIPQLPVVDPVVTNERVKLRLVRVIDDETAVVRIDGGSSQTVLRGEVFGEVFAMSSTRVDDNEATFRFGDGERFTLSAGQSKTVVITS